MVLLVRRWVIQGSDVLAGSVAVLVGDAHEWFIPKVVEAAKQIKVSPRVTSTGCGMGPLIDEASVARVTKAIEAGVEAGSRVIVRWQKSQTSGGGVCWTDNF